MRRGGARDGARGVESGIESGVESGGGRAPGRLVLFVVVVAAIPTAVGVGFLAAGATLPAPGPVLLLALVAALAVNRSVFFPSEQAATAEVAVVLAAVTGFAGDARWTGPLVVALLVGPLDVSHWEGRSFLRMAYNAGNRGLAGLAATAAYFVVGTGAADGVAAVAAAVAFVAVDLAVSSALLVVQGTSPRLAVARVVTIDRFALPLALLGAAVGFVADRFGWWLAVILLAPLAFVPEQLIVTRARLRWRRPGARLGSVLAAGVAVTCALWLLVPSRGFATGAALLTVAVLVGGELEVDARRPVPPLLVVVVVAGAVVVTGAGAYVLAPVAAVVAGVTAWSCATPRPTRARAATAVVVVVAASVTTVALASLARPSFGVLVPALLAAMVVPLAAVVVGDQRRARAVAFGWSAPFVALAVALAGAWRVVGLLGALLFASWLGVVVVMARSFGVLPWRVSCRARTSRPTLACSHRGALVIAATAVVLLASLSVLSSVSDLSVVAAWLAVAVVESMAAVDLVGIRQWRFAPQARVATSTLVAIGALLGAGAGAAAVDGHRWCVAALPVAALCLVGAGWVPARAVDATRQVASPVGKS